ncbi:hypothetical protein EV121DRAFT_297265 [Schizophyllum commune]
MSRASSPSATADSGAHAIAVLRRQLDRSRLAVAQSQGLKRGKADPFNTAARGFCRLIAVEQDILTLQAEADRRDEATQAIQDGEEVEPLSVEEQREADRTHRSYCLLLRLVTDLERALSGPTSDLEVMLKKIQHAGNTARSEDIMSIRAFLAQALSNAPYNCHPPLDPRDRSDRGLQNPVTGALLCPISFDIKDPNTLSKVRNGDPDYLLGSDFFLHYLYARGAGNPEDVTEGFLRSALLVEAYRTVFISKRRSEDEDSDSEGNEEEAPPVKKRKLQQGTEKKPSTKPNVATLLRMDGQVTPRSIAYIAVLVHFNLTDATQWRRQVYGVNYGALYNFIVDYFEDFDETTEVGKLAQANAQDLLKWWNRKIFPGNFFAKVNVQASRNKLAAQLAAKVAANAV